MNLRLDITKDYNREDFLDFLYSDFLPDDYEQTEEEQYYPFTNIENAFCLGRSESLDLDIFEFCTKSVNDPRVTLTKEVCAFMKKMQTKQNVLAVFYSPKSHTWRLSLITTEIQIINGKTKPLYSNPKRFSFKLGKNCKKHTPESMLNKKVSSFDDLKSRFSVEVVTKEFYNELFAWYTWACSVAKYPTGFDEKVKLSQNNNEQHLIRLITRLMFVWFIKQKDLIPSWIFDEKELQNILVDCDLQSSKKSNYYNAVLQNLFFATLNKAINERKFADNKNGKTEFGVNSYYRDDKTSSFFKISKEKIIELFMPVPFLNGGLFECLDRLEGKENNHNTQEYIDGFSRESGRRAFLPNALFFMNEKDGHEGLIHILNRYNFTVEENSPSDIQVALDPELLGKVFENLLGTFNPETSESARKESGSFYTPREIVSFMVNEALKNYLKANVKDITENQIKDLFNESTDDYNESNKNQIETALKNVKVFDPACGSGAFPVGVLSELVYLIKKLDEKYLDSEEVYKLKLELIQNCIYGSDIQTIAAQIAKLRFFITLICEKEKTGNKENNYGFDPLPNLETKFVAANSLIGKKKSINTNSLFTNEEIEKTKAELQETRRKHFTATNTREKAQYRKDDKDLREKLAKLLKEDHMYDNESAKQLASWNPYDQNAVSDFFDSEWMFGITDGFDIVIGNPPYISTKGVSTEAKKQYEAEFGFSDDTYNLFTFKGLSLCKKNGTLNYIIPKTFWTTQTKRNMRDLLLQNQINYIFDTANPFESAMVDTCILQVAKTPASDTHKLQFLDGTKDLAKPEYFEPILQSTYKNTQNSVIFKPSDYNLKIWNLYGKKVKDLYEKWWDKIETSKKIAQNSNELEKYRKNLKPGDVALLGCLTEGGQGLATANNGKYIAVRSSTKWAKNIVASRPKKLSEAMAKKKELAKELEKEMASKTCAEYLDSLTETQIAQKFDAIKEKYGRDIFGQGYIYKIIDDSEIADVNALTQDEKDNGIDTTKNYYVPYDKGDKDGNRWYLETPFAIAWSKENVHFLKTNSGKKGEGMPVVRNPQFYFKEGFCWIDVNSTYLKARVKANGVFDVLSMSLFTMTKIPDWYYVLLINSRFISLYVDTFVNNTSHFQINDARQVPVIIPNKEQFEKAKSLFEKATELKHSVSNGEKSSKETENELQIIEKQVDELVLNLYGIKI